jgi:uncharacterized protein YegP (UPF0339 family)
MAGKGETYKRADGKFAFRVKASNGEAVATDGGQGYNARADAKSTLEKLMRGDYNGPITDLD